MLRLEFLTACFHPLAQFAAPSFGGLLLMGTILVCSMTTPSCTSPPGGQGSCSW